MKRAPRPDLSAGETARLGEQLRDARIALGLSIEDMAASLRIRRVYLAALEEGRVRELPAPAYVLGFVRTYARALGLDDDEMVRRFRESGSAQPVRRTDLVFPEPVPDRGVPAGAVIIAGVALVMGAYLAWFQWSGGRPRIADVVPPVPQRLEQAQRERTVPPTPGPGLITPNSVPGLPPAASAIIAGSLQPLPGQPAQGQSPLSQQSRLPTPLAGTVLTAPLAPSPGPQAAAAATAPAFAQAPALAPAAPAPAFRTGERLQLHAKADTWITIRDRASGTTVVNRLLRQGEVLPVQLKDGLFLTAGYAPGLEILVDGTPTPPFPASAAVRRDIPLELDRLRAGNYGPVAAAAPARPSSRDPNLPENAAYVPPQ